MNQDSSAFYRRAGYCPICEAAAEFRAQHSWYRDHLLCSGCGSVPRERALALVLLRRFPDWRTLEIHESSPIARGISLKLSRECTGYVASQYYPDQPLGVQVNGFRNEDLEAQSFADQSFDIVVALDVMEHVNQPDDVLREICRTLKPGGAFICTVPTYKDRVTSERQALTMPDGAVAYYVVPEYHGNPVNSAGSLVTYKYGHDFAELINKWSAMDVEVFRFHDHEHGIIGDFTDVYLATKRTTNSAEVSSGSNDTPAFDPADRWPSDVRALCESSARGLEVVSEVHKEDLIFRFVWDHTGFASKETAVDYYFNDGANSAAKVSNLVGQWMGEHQAPLTILEFAAGYGAVTRHAIKSLAPHILHSSDIHPAANAFLSQMFGVQSVQSVDIPEAFTLTTQYDVIFVLSFFSHMPQSTWGRWLQRLYSGLRPGGILLFTTHGATSTQYFPNAKLDDAGYWFDQSSEQGDLDTAKYGQTITSKAFVDAQIALLPDAEYLAREEAGWWGHQDLYIVRKHRHSNISV